VPAVPGGGAGHGRGDLQTSGTLVLDATLFRDNKALGGHGGSGLYGAGGRRRVAWGPMADLQTARSGVGPGVGAHRRARGSAAE